MKLPQVIEIMDKSFNNRATRQVKLRNADLKFCNIIFLINKEKDIREGKHYIALQGEELKKFKADLEIQGNLKYAHTLYLWTEKGALLHAKSLNTDKAWEVYDYLVDFYFRVKEGEKLPVVRETKSVSIEKQDAKETFDIAPYFISVVEKVPIEALDAMEKSFRKSNSKTVKLATLSILAEKMKRNIE